MPKRLADKIAVVTGGAQGLGFTIATALYNEGARVAVVDIAEEAVHKAALRLDDSGEHSMGAVVDVTQKEQVRAFLKKLQGEWGTIDILVNNAGGALHTPHRLEEIEEKHWDLVMNVNLKGAFFFCQEAILQMAGQTGGSIVNISALAGHWYASLAGVQYTAAKAGIEGLTRQLAHDWGNKNIRVNAVAPTVTMTGERVKGLWDQKSDDEKRKVLSAIPLGRLSTPEEISAVVVFLASDESSYITGTTVDVNGGRYLH